MNHRPLIACMLLAVWLGAPLAAARLEDPRTGQVEKIAPGAKALHLVFFATWCPDCIKELSELRDLEARWDDRGYELVIVAVNTRQTAGRLAEFLTENKPPGRLLFDVKGEAARQWKADRLPTHVVLDAAGKEVVRSSELNAAIDEALAALLGGGASQVSSSRRVGLLFGGRSVEHEVSVDSARSVAAALNEAGFAVVPLGVTGEGRWLSPELSSELLNSEAERVEPVSGKEDEARVAIVPGGSSLLCCRPGAQPRAIELDVVFPLIHGWGGEDGRTQGALDLAGLPCVGAGVCGSAIGMDKVLSRRLLEAQGLPTVRWMAFGHDAYNRATEAAHRSILSELKLPLFVKPANGGSSVGISKVSAHSALGAALEAAFAHDGTVVVEEGIDAREIECAVLGNERPKASGLGEIVPSREFYDYEAKYVDGTSELKIPAPLDDETSEAIRAHAVTAFRSLGLSGMARVDFLVDRGSGQLYLNEVNTLPGFTSISMFPKLWEAAGVAYPRLVARLVELALERWEDERSHRTVFKPA